MIEPSLLLAFILASLLLLFIPGPAVLYIITRSLDQGRGAGLASVFGLGLGTLVQIFCVALGISAVILSSTLAFNILKFLGALYLIYIGIRRFREKGDVDVPQITERLNLSKIFLQGVVLDVLNLKTGLFFLAYFPQFIDVSKGSYIGQVFFLGMLFVALSLIVGGGYALLAGKLGIYFKKRSLFVKTHRYIAACVYIGLGLATAISGL